MVHMPLDAAVEAPTTIDLVPQQRGEMASLRSGTPATSNHTRTRRTTHLLVWVFRALLLIPFILMAPEIYAAVIGHPGAIANLSSSDADVLGTSTFLIFVLMMTVTPLVTVTGWRWHVVLRRDFGTGMFAVALTDIVLAAISTGDTFSGGVLGRLGGHSFLLAGSLSTALLVPLVLTANRRAQRWLGKHW